MKHYWARCLTLAFVAGLLFSARAETAEFQGQTITYTGATTNWVDGELVLKYTDVSQVGSLVLPGAVEARMLLVGGGGAGASPATTAYGVGGAGGGGAGGMLEVPAQSTDEGIYQIFGNGNYQVYVGAGGAAGGTSTASYGANGSPSGITNVSANVKLLAYGGGGGGQSKDASSGTGNAGGSGGGGSAYKSSSTHEGGASLGGQGNKGGSGLTTRAGGGGGGAGSAGGDTSKDGTTFDYGGNGGDGKESNITGDWVMYAGGGGGGTMGNYSKSNTGVGGYGGSDIGGEGGGGTTKSRTPGGAGKAETGSGGGGGAYQTAGGAGGSGVVIIRIKRLMPSKPPAADSAVFGEVKVVYTNTSPDIVTIVNNDSGESVAAITTVGLSTGQHTFTSSLKAGYTWSDGSSGSVTTTITITKPNLKVESLTIEGWQYKDEPKNPVLVVTTEGGIPVELPQENVLFKYRTKGTTEWSAQKATLPEWKTLVQALAPNFYEVTAEITGTKDYDPPKDIPTAGWEVWRAASIVEGLGYSTTLTISGLGTTAADKILPVVLSEKRCPFFLYRHVQADGSDIRFIDTNGNVLASKIETWNPSGESLVWVKVPNAKTGTQIKMCWGQLVDENGDDLPVPAIPTDTLNGYLIHYAFEGNTTNTGTGNPTGVNNDGMNPTYVDSGVAGYGKAVTKWTGYGTNNPTLPSSYVIESVVRANQTADKFYVIWAFGPRTAGFGLVSRADGTVRLVELNATGSYKTVIETKVTNVSTTYHRYRLEVRDGTKAELLIDGVSVGTGTITARTTIAFQFGSVTSGVPTGLLRDSRDAKSYQMADFSLTAFADITFDHLVVAPDACFKNRWITAPSMPSSWGTGEEPTPDKKFLGDPAYGKSFFTITDIKGDVITNAFPTTAGGYKLTVIVEADGDLLKTWQRIQRGPQDVSVTAHSPTSDLSGTEGSATRSGRVLLVNDFDDGTQKITDQEYDHTTGEIHWIHANETKAEKYENLKPGTMHVLNATNAVKELCGATNIWRLTDAYIGNTLKSTMKPSEGKKSIYLPTTEKNQTHIVFRNLESASIQSAGYTNGIGTIYFDAINGAQNAARRGYSLRVEVAKGVPSSEEDPEWEVMDIYPLFKDTGSETFQKLPATKTLSLDATIAETEDCFYRVYVPVNLRGPVMFRIVRDAVTDAFEGDYGGFILIDNIAVSYPASRADLETYGLFDEAKRGEAVLGYEGAWSEPFPSINDQLFPKARPVYSMNPGSKKQPEINTATMHYRWRYLNQVVMDWQTASFETETMRSVKPLDVPKGRVGDIEFWYDLVANAPYYKYYDYSGLKDSGNQPLRLGNLYSEEIAYVTNRLNSTVAMPSRGTDWFVRLREGTSDREAFKAVVEKANGEPFATVDFILFDNHLWRGFLKTLDPVEGGLRFRIVETVPTQLEPDFVLATNDWKLVRNISSIPASATYVEAGKDDWTTLVCDAGTGYLKFQLDDTTKVVTITHADRQTFNTWNDAHKSVFVGNSTDTNRMSGVSSRMNDYNEEFIGWTDTPSTNQYWREAFINPAGDFTEWSGYKVFEPFPNAATPNGWTAGPGMWVNEMYKLTTKSGALQMEGRGLGYLEYTGATGDTTAPRGLESLSYRARLAQTVEFDDIVYNWADGQYDKPSYTFAVSTAMSDDGWVGADGTDDFDGAGQLSLVACYVPQVGCYEFRLTRTDEKYITLALYKWTTSGGVFSAQLLNKASKTIDLRKWKNASGREIDRPIQNLPFWKYKEKSSDSDWLYSLLYISVETMTDGTKRIQGGFSYDDKQRVKYDKEPGGKYMNVSYLDAKPLGNGTYGLASASCSAVFVHPRHWDGPVTWLGGTTQNEGKVTDGAVTWSTETRSFDDTSFKANRWALKDGRYAKFSDESGYRWGFKAQMVPQNVILQCTNAKGEWVGLVTNTVTGFTLSDTVTKYFYRVDNARYRLRHGGKYADARNDVVIDNFEIRQWVGDKYGSIDTIAFRAPDDGKGYCTNFVYTSGWVKDGLVQLNARRTTPGTPCSIRSPIMDGKDNSDGKRGVGLGMISFSYGYVEPHVNLLVQIVTNNVNAGNLKDLTASVSIGPSYWITVTNFTADVLNASPTRSQNVYIGMHGVEGLMRIAIDPKVVEAAAKVKDQPDYGRIDITSVFCRDEPALDLRCWWGWNVHALNDDNTISTIDDGTRMYLPDCDERKAGDKGMSFALNNSITDDTNPKESETYNKHLPFLQTPTQSNRVGEVSFRARRIDNDTESATSQVCLYGAESGDPNIPDSSWQFLTSFNVTNNYYEIYRWRAQSAAYHSFRFVVYGVKGIDPEIGGMKPPTGEVLPPVRVLLEDVVVSEAVYPSLGFGYVYPVRTGLSDNQPSKAVDESGHPNRDEQPLVGENWTIQAKIEKMQMPDELDLTTPGHEPKVTFFWFEGKTPWGFANWKDLGAKQGVKSAELTLAEGASIGGENMVFRGSLMTSPAAVVEEVSKDTTFQYAAIVEYWDMKGNKYTNTLSKTEWERPSWYDPIDLNAGRSEADFSAFTFLGQISPGRAWINEINIYDGKTDDYQYPGQEYQFIEIAVPSGQSLEGWRLEYVNNSLSTTNKFCFFSTKSGCVTPSKKSYETNDYVFITVQSPKSADAKSWERQKHPVDGKPIVIDGTWDDFNLVGGNLPENTPIAIRLVRPNDVVEQEVAFEGYNFWAGWGQTKSLDGHVTTLNANGTVKPPYYAVGSESNNWLKVGVEGQSLGAMRGTGATTADWSAEGHQTPGWCNEGQIIPEGWAIWPNGAMLVVTAKVDPSGHVKQTVAGEGPTTESVRVSMAKGGAGTNITYYVDAWYELDAIVADGKPMALPAPTEVVRGVKRYELEGVGKGCSNNFTIVATSRIWDDLETKYGLTADNRYTDAVKAWLNGGKNFFGEEFKNPGEIHLAEYRDLQNNFITNLTLTSMYWLDMDPTVTNAQFRAGVTQVKPQEKTEKKRRSAFLSRSITPPGGVEPEGDASNKNIRVTVQMYMTNTASQAWSAPYILRGVEPGSTSAEHSQTGVGNWNAVTFKVTGDLQNDNPNRERWVPLRWFYFLPDASKANLSASFDEWNQATIEVWDPFDTLSGWKEFINCSVFYSWSIDGRNAPTTVESLKPDSTFKDE